MEIYYQGFNVPNVILSSTVDLTPGTTSIVGTADDYKIIYSSVAKSGILRGEMTLDGTRLAGTMVCNVNEYGIEAHTITNEGGTLRVILLWLYLDGLVLNVDVTVKELA